MILVPFSLATTTIDAATIFGEPSKIVRGAIERIAPLEQRLALKVKFFLVIAHHP
jgi:hypothetical protein